MRIVLPAMLTNAPAVSSTHCESTVLPFRTAGSYMRHTEPCAEIIHAQPSKTFCISIRFCRSIEISGWKLVLWDLQPPFKELVN